MAAIEVLIVLLLVGLAGGLFAVGIDRPGSVRVATLVESVGVLVGTLLLALYVAGDDPYRDDGTSRWDAHARPGLTGGAIALGVAVAFTLALAWVSRRRSIAFGGFLAAAAAAAVQCVAVIGNTGD